MRRMYSESQIHKIAAEEAGKLDKVIPTDIGAKSDGALVLLHDGKEIDSTPLPMKQLFGKHTITGEGNIDLYVHNIQIVYGTHEFSWIGSFESSNGLKIDSIQDLLTVAAGRVINGSGYVDINGGAQGGVGALVCGSTITDTSFVLLTAVDGSMKMSDVGECTIEDKVSTI